jgi:hypothetical protein
MVKVNWKRRRNCEETPWEDEKLRVIIIMTYMGRLAANGSQCAFYGVMGQVKAT